MTSKTVAIKLFGENATTECSNCGEEYKIKDSDAWDMQLFCSGDCEVEFDNDIEDDEEE